MPTADSIASHGKTGRVSALSIGSLGRLLRGIEEVIISAKTEIINLVSAIHPVMELISKVGK